MLHLVGALHNAVKLIFAHLNSQSYVDEKSDTGKVYFPKNLRLSYSPAFQHPSLFIFLSPTKDPTQSW